VHSWGKKEATPIRWARGHWEIEDSVFCASDVTYHGVMRERQASLFTPSSCTICLMDAEQLLHARIAGWLG
jgi:hypothetical protein